MQKKTVFWVNVKGDWLDIGENNIESLQITKMWKLRKFSKPELKHQPNHQIKHRHLVGVLISANQMYDFGYANITFKLLAIIASFFN